MFKFFDRLKLNEKHPCKSLQDGSSLHSSGWWSTPKENEIVLKVPRQRQHLAQVN